MIREIGAILRLGEDRLSPRSACFIEVKSCTVAKDGIDLFPDAPTER